MSYEVVLSPGDYIAVYVSRGFTLESGSEVSIRIFLAKN